MGRVHEDGQGYSLEELGIGNSTNVHGKEQLTIILPPNPLLGTGQVQAVFDPEKKNWTLEMTSKVKFGQDKYEVFQRKDSRLAEIDLSARPVSWTKGLPRIHHVDRFLNAIDWESTPVGSLESWPLPLRVFINLVFADDEPACIYWGQDLCAMFNSAFYILITDRLTKQQEYLGMPFKRMWPELWNDFEPMLETIAARGVGIETLEVNLFPVKDGIVEETFYQGSFLPIRDEAGKVQGFYNRARETTKIVINDRRAKVLSAISAKPNLTGDFIFQHLITSLSLCERDFPLAFVYSAQEDTVVGKCHLKYQCGIGVPDAGHALIPSEMELFEGKTGFLPYFRKAKSKDRVLVLHQHDGSLPDQLTAGFAWRGFGEPSRSIAILPLSTSDRILGIMVVGLNPRRPYDDEFQGFMDTLQRSMSATVASSMDREEAQARAGRLAQQLEDSERSIREIAEFGPVGIVRYSLAGTIAWANDQYYEITGHGREVEDHYKLSFLDVVADEDRDMCASLWAQMAVGKERVTIPIRLKKTWRPPRDVSSQEPEEQNIWVLANAYPIFDAGEIKAYAGSVTDISRFKWAETVQSKSAAAAKEAKRLQGDFIDMVSHEMRNPLSAITQLSDAIASSLQQYEKTAKREAEAKDLLESNVENANTILLCAAHQKRVIDDVLTLSKLDSMMLSVTPVVVQPEGVVEGVLKMFERELQVNDIAVQSEKSPSYSKLGVEWVRLDPSRLTQIFINLITNAVKFTKLEPVRRITITIGASLERPSNLAGVRWFPSHRAYKDVTKGPEWGQGESVYIWAEIQDTGRGLEQEEMGKLFGRFQQANEHLKHQYGGSGLGLFISRELTETQGGEIGVRSEPRKGTTFAFYVRGRKAEAPKEIDKVPPTAFSKHGVHHETQGAAEKQEHRRTSHSLVATKSDRSSLSILLVEDNVINSRILAEQLKGTGAKVVVANHGGEALDCLGKSRAWKDKHEDTQAIDFDVVLMDTEMPIMDGLACTRRIRQLEKEGVLDRHINIIATTANGRQESIDAVMQAGADTILPKPFRVKECIAKIRALLESDTDMT